MQRRVQQHDGDVWTDDSVEMFLATDPADPFRYYHLVVNSLGTTRDEYWDGPQRDVSWESHARASALTTGTGWTVQIVIPLSSLNRLPILADTWAANFARERYTTRENSTWQPYDALCHEPQHYAAIGLPGVSSIPSVRQMAANLIYARVNAATENIHGLLRQLGRTSHRTPC